MKELEDKKKIVENFVGFYSFNTNTLYEDPTRDLVNLIGNFKFENPVYISQDYNYILGRSVQCFSKKTLDDALCSGASLITSNQIFNNKPYMYVLSWNNISNAYNGTIIAVDDLTQFNFIYKESSIFTSILYEINNNENIDTKAGLVGTYIYYKIVPNNPSNEDIEKFLFNQENCDAIGFIFIQIQLFLQELLNLYQQGIIKEEIPEKWFSDTTNCQEQALILNQNLLKFYVNVNPNYYQTYFKQDIDIDNILKLYN
jgi:hypothetical protein